VLVNVDSQEYFTVHIILELFGIMAEQGTSTILPLLG